MKWVIRAFLILGVIVLFGFFLGPRPASEIQTTFDPATLPQDLDAYLAEVEANVPNLLQGAEKEIVWANAYSKRKTEKAIVYVHGFSASKNELRPVPDDIAKALGANLYYARLAGHGRDGNGLADGHISKWADDFSEAIAIGERLGEKVYVIGTSNGGALTTWGVSQPQFAERISGIALISPAYELQGFPTWLANMPWAEVALPALFGEHRSWEPYNDLHGKWWTHSYPSKAVFPVTSLLSVLKDIDKSTISVPALFVLSRDDTVVVANETEAVAAQWGANHDMFVLEGSGDPDNHVIAGDILSPQTNKVVTDRIVTWFSSLGS